MKIYTDQTKHKRAKDVLSLVKGEPTTTHIKSEYSKESQEELRIKFIQFLKEAKIKPSDDEAIDFIYEKLGGLITTTEEEKVTKTKAKSRVQGTEEEAPVEPKDEDETE